MMALIARSGAWLMQQAASLPDTLVMKPVAADRGLFETVTGVATIVIALALVSYSVIAAPAALAIWKTAKKVRRLVDRLDADIRPLTRHAGNVADNVDYITTSIRSEVQRVNATMASANRRLQQAVDITETRLNEFNALLEVVQDEAEQAFVSTAAVVRGVRTGAAKFGADDAGSDGTEEQEGGEEDGDDNERDKDSLDELPLAGSSPARPRLRSRRKRGRR